MIQVGAHIGCVQTVSSAIMQAPTHFPNQVNLFFFAKAKGLISGASSSACISVIHMDGVT
jgi:hypothetical protein